MEELNKLLGYISLDAKYKQELLYASLKQIHVKQKNHEWTFVLQNPTNFSSELFFALEDALKEAYKMVLNIRLEVEVEKEDSSKIPEYYERTLEKVKDVQRMSMIFKDNLVSDGDTYNIEVTNVAERHQVEEMIDKINDFYRDYGFTSKIGIIMNEEKSAETKQKIQESVESARIVEPVKKVETEKPKSNGFRAQKTAPDENCVLGRTIKDTPVPIQSIVGEDNNITVAANVFGVDLFESSKTDFKIITLKITDYTDSIYCKVFVRDDEEYARLQKELKAGKWFIIRGYTKNDAFAKEIVLNARDIMKYDHPDESRKDENAEKRVELHAHTKMSQMDGVMDAKAYIRQAVSWGHKAAAVTDHNAVQAFPDVFHYVTDYNKHLKEGQEPFKAIYGAEFMMVDDSVDIVIRPSSLPLLDTTYVVFDLETTGFNATGGDSIIEIGAVKMHQGEIIDRFDELINPGRKLPTKITEITNITDEMLKDKDNEENAVKRFLAWTGDAPVVAHNAKFDTSFVLAAMDKYNLGEFENTIIDTLKLSQTLDNTYARHSLSALVKRYDVPWDESAHHRGDYDAEGTALVFYKMLKKLDANNYKTIEDFNRLVAKDEIYKYGVTHHINVLAKNKTGLKNLFRLISLANTKYLYKVPRIPRSEVEALREGLLIGSGCYESEVFSAARSKGDQELTNIISFYDYVEVQPPEVYQHLVDTHDFDTKQEVVENIKKIISATEQAGKLIVATGDVHQLNPEDRIYREIIVNQKVPGGGRHPLAKSDIKEIPNQYFRTTDEMLEAFPFISEEERHKIVIENPNKIADMCEILEVIIDTGGIPFSPKVRSDDGKSYLDCPAVVTELVYTKAADWYGDPLPYNIESRIATELYGDIVYRLCKQKVEEEEPNLTDEEKEAKSYAKLHETILKGFDSVKELVREHVLANWTEEDGEQTDDKIAKKVKKELGGIIGGGFDPIYLIAQRLVRHSNEDGYIVGSRGSVGSSFVATMMGITEVNPLPAHYLCKNESCKYSEFIGPDGVAYSKTFSSGYDLPDKVCPKCGEPLGKEGQDMPFATFLGFNADKVPDIDLNFSGDNQASAHAYTKVLFGEENVYRAGTIGTVAEKTAFGYVKGYCEDKGITNMRTAEVERIAAGCTGVKRTTGQHPGGIVVIPQYMDVYDFTPFQYPADDPTAEWKTTHFEYHAIDQDVLKLDILGHDDPTVLRKLQDLSGIDVKTIPFDDQEVYSLLTSPTSLGVSEEQIECPTGTLGLPELGTRFVINMLVETKPKTFSELVKISGLSHGTDVWAGNASELIKNNVVPFKDVIGCRDDIMVNLMNYGMAPKDAFKIMEFVRKGKAKKIPDEWKIWKEKMEQANIPDWYIESCHKIQYMFPKAHACAYVMSALRIAWFKVHHPNWYYVAYFSIRVDDFDIETMIKGYDAIKAKMDMINAKGFEATNKESGILDSLHVALEATARGIKFANISIEKSDSRYFVIDENDPNTLIPPFKTIDGLGENVANQIVEERKKKYFLSIEDLQKRGKISSTLIDKMRLMGMLEDLPESSQMTLF